MNVCSSAMRYLICGSEIFTFKTGIILRHYINGRLPDRNGVNNEVFSIPIRDETIRALKMRTGLHQSRRRRRKGADRVRSGSNWNTSIIKSYNACKGGGRKRSWAPPWKTLLAETSQWLPQARLNFLLTTTPRGELALCTPRMKCHTASFHAASQPTQVEARPEQAR